MPQFDRKASGIYFCCLHSFRFVLLRLDLKKFFLICFIEPLNSNYSGFFYIKEVDRNHFNLLFAQLDSIL